MCPGIMEGSLESGPGVAGRAPFTDKNAADSKKRGNADGTPTMNGTGEGKQIDKRTAEQKEREMIAPELVHITQGYHSLALLVSRLKQDTFNRLTDLIEDIQEGTEVQRKMKIINFMMERRQQWTKILVLVMYAKKAQDLPGLIDLSNYFWHFKETTTRFLGEMIRMRYDFVTAK